jgi:hypothetical protein
MLAQDHGAIINICSTYGLVGPDQRIYEKPGQPQQYKPVYYSVTKAGVLGLTHYLATYYTHRLRANALTPAASSTTTMKSSQGLFRPHRHGPHGPPGRDERALLFLASDASSYMTGNNVVVMGAGRHGSFHSHSGPARLAISASCWSRTTRLKSRNVAAPIALQQLYGGRMVQPVHKTCQRLEVSDSPELEALVERLQTFCSRFHLDDLQTASQVHPVSGASHAKASPLAPIAVSVMPIFSNYRQAHILKWVIGDAPDDHARQPMRQFASTLDSVIQGPGVILLYPPGSVSTLITARRDPRSQDGRATPARHAVQIVHTRLLSVSASFRNSRRRKMTRPALITKSGQIHLAAYP